MPQPPPTHAPSTDWGRITSCLRRAARALSRNDAEADDLVQQTLVRLLTGTPDRADHLGYARRTMLRLWIDQQRAVRRRVSRWADLAALHASRWGVVDLDSPDGQERAQAIRLAIGALPARQRAALVLRLVEGLDYQHIASILECDIGAVRASMHLARKRLRRSLGGESAESEWHP